MHPRAWLPALVAVAFVAIAFGASAAPAGAHARLLASVPAAGERVAKPPRTVVLTFDEPVETGLGSLDVLDVAGRMHAIGPVAHPNGDPERVSIGVDALATGRYVVVWRVVSDDSHVVSGAFAFGVGVDAGDPPVPPNDPAALPFLAVVRFVMFAGVLFAIGVPIGVAVLDRPAAGAAEMGEFTAWAAVAFTAATDIVLRAGFAGGTLGGALTTRVGELRAIEIVAAVFGIVAIVGRRRIWWLVCASSIVTVVSLSASGHAADTAPAWLGIAADALHLGAAAAWTGVLSVAIARGPRLDPRRIASVASAAAVTIVLTGIIQTVRNVGSPAAMWTTAYGREIDAKIGLLLGVLALALASQRAIARGERSIGRRVRAELILLFAVVAVSAVLVETPLARDVVATRAAVTTAR
jgi:copper transport protein